MDNPVVADVAEGTGGGSPIGVQWPTQPAAPGKIIRGGFSSHQKAKSVRGHIGYRWNRHTDKKRIHQWTDVREPDDSFGVTIAHPGVIQYERLNFVAPVLCAWEPGLRAWGANYENGVPFPEPGDREIFMKSVPGEDYTASLFLRSHRGSWDASQAYKLGSETNYPLLVGYPDTLSGSQLDESTSFLALTPDNVILTVLKKAEDGSGYVARFYEASDTDSQVALSFGLPKNVGAVKHADLLEDGIENLTVSKSKVSMNILGFGIETLKLFVEEDDLVDRTP